MSFENFDNKIKESLEQGSHSYDESSWDKMKIMLDRHMPQKKNNRRRLFIFLFMFLLLGGGTTLILNKNYSESDINPVTHQTNDNPAQIKEESAGTGTNTDKSASVPSTLNKKNNKPFSDITSLVSITGKPAAENKIPEISERPNPVRAGTDIINKTDAGTSSEISVTRNAISAIGSGTKENIIQSQNEFVKKEISRQKIDLTESEVLADKQLHIEIDKASSKKKQSFLNNILISLSAAADISSVGNNIGNVKLITGAGLGYKISDRFTVRSGVFVGRKVYTTGPEDYNPPSSFWSYYPNLKQIEADCKVVEIPVNLDYNFSFSKSANWFISAGVSSFLMKKEDYNYYYKPASSQQYIYYKRTFENKNKHYFSILNLSAGYSRKISPALTLQAEPFMKIALKGIGYGKVKLNSVGVMITANLQPFGSKK